METFKQIGQAAEYFKKHGVVGSTCVLTEGPKTHRGRDKYKQVREGFRQCGVRVRIEGEYGNRTITLSGFGKINRHPRQVYVAAKEPGPRTPIVRPTIMRVIGLVETIGKTVYVEGNRDRIRQKLRDRFGAWSCSVTRHPNRIGWNVTRNK
jgi:hypothetical protein